MRIVLIYVGMIKSVSHYFPQEAVYAGLQVLPLQSFAVQVYWRPSRITNSGILDLMER